MFGAAALLCSALSAQGGMMLEQVGFSPAALCDPNPNTERPRCCFIALQRKPGEPQEA